MPDLMKRVGKRLRQYRTEQHISQEKLSEMAGCHPTYIGQIERGEKNATIGSLEKIATALGVSLSELFEDPHATGVEVSPARRCYDLVAGKSRAEQEHLYRLLLEADQYKQE